MGCTISRGQQGGFIESYNRYFSTYDKSDVRVSRTYLLENFDNLRVDNLENPTIIYQPTYNKISREFFNQHIEYLDPYFHENLENLYSADDCGNAGGTDSEDTGYDIGTRDDFYKQCIIDQFETWTRCIFFSQDNQHLIYARGATLYLYHIESKTLKQVKWTDRLKNPPACMAAVYQDTIVTFELNDDPSDKKNKKNKKEKRNIRKGKLAVWNFNLEKQREVSVDLQDCNIWNVWEEYGARVHRGHLICAHCRLVYAINIDTGKLKYHSGNIENHGCEIAYDYIHVFCERFLYPEDFRDRVDYQTDNLVKKHRPTFW